MIYFRYLGGNTIREIEAQGFIGMSQLFALYVYIVLFKGYMLTRETPRSKLFVLPSEKKFHSKMKAFAFLL